MRTAEDPLDEQGLQVFTDWLLERGFEPIHTDTFPWPMRLKGQISSVSIYWYSGRYSGSGRPLLEMGVNVEWESTRTRYRPTYAEQTQGIQKITWDSATSAVLRAMELSQRIDASAAPKTPGIPDGMEMPPGLTKDGKHAWETLVKFFVKKGLTYTGGGTSFYSPAEWEEKERAPFSGLLVVTHDGGEPKRALNPEPPVHPEDQRLYDQLGTVLGKNGFYRELLFGWATGVYKLGDYR